MTEKEKCDKGLLYNANYDNEMIELRLKCKALCFELNNINLADVEGQIAKFRGIVKEVGQRPVITTPFWCDYGFNITIGDNFYCNHNLTILDCASVNIGDNVFIAPNCCFSTARTSY